jgi:demethylmenaquinone methyltransferase/2-methoxy-6-polyprenyl-1,4-benzoquinol methylase
MSQNDSPKADQVLKTKSSDDIRKMFDEVSSQYDFLNHSLSAGLDFYWRKRAVAICRNAILAQKLPEALALDVATGTGDLAVALSKLPKTKVVGVDLSNQMLEVARKKTSAVDFYEGNALDLEFKSNVFDVVTAGFGVRNFENLVQGLSEMQRVLKRGGTCVIIEPMIPQHILRGAYLFYFKNILPRIAGLFSESKFAYDYLPKSVMSFPQGEAFIWKLNEAGFKSATFQTLSFQTAIIYTAKA